MAAWLENLRIGEVSLVDDPCNDEAVIVIVKSRPSPLADLAAEIEAARESLVEKSLHPTDAAEAALVQEQLMDLQAMTAALRDAEQTITDITKSRDDALARVTALEADLATAQEEVTKAKAKPEDEDEAFLKALPEAARAKVLADRAEIAELRKARADAEAAREESEAIAKAKAFTAGDDEAKTVGGLLHRIAKGKTTADDAGLIEGILKSARTLTGKSPLFAPAGSSATEGGEPEDVYKARAEEILKAKPGLTAEQAYAEAVAEQPNLYGEYVAKRRGLTAA